MIRPCPLCKTDGNNVRLRSQDARLFTHCENCRLIYADPGFLPDVETEKANYLTHENSPENEHYVQFLRRATDSVLPFLEPGNKVMDFGCGPAPVLAKIMHNAGFSCDLHDPIFFPENLRMFEKSSYNAVFATECFEHFHQPDESIAEVCSYVKPGGYLVVMTELWTDISRFSGWYYTRDVTHVCFYHEKTFDHICAVLGFRQVPTQDRRVIVLKKVNKTVY